MDTENEGGRDSSGNSQGNSSLPRENSQGVGDVFHEYIKLQKTRKAKEKKAKTLSQGMSQMSTTSSKSSNSGALDLERAEEAASTPSLRSDIEAMSTMMAKISNKEELQDIISKYSNRNELVGFIRNYIRFCSTNNGAEININVKKRLWVFEAAISSVFTNSLVSKAIADLLLTEADNLPERTIPFLIELVLDRLTNWRSDASNFTPDSLEDPARLFEFVSKFIYRIRSVGRIDPDGLCKQNLSVFDSNSYRNHIISHICSIPWERKLHVPLITLLRDLTPHMDSSTVKILLRKSLSMLDESTIEDLPEVSYQLLLLSSNLHQEVQSECLTNICRVFSHYLELENGFRKSATMTLVGSFVARFNVLISQDVRLGTLFIKLCSKTNLIFLPKNQALIFFILLMSQARIKRYESQILEISKKILHDAFEKEEMKRNSHWLAQFYIDTDVARSKKSKGQQNKKSSSNLNNIDNGQTVSLLIKDLFKKVIEISTLSGGWDIIVPSLVSFGVLLADEYNSYTKFLHSNDDVPWENEDLSMLDSYEVPRKAKISLVGIYILAKCFKHHSSVRVELLSQITSRIIIAAAGSAPGTLQFIRFLSLIVRESPTTMIEYIHHLKDILNYLPTMLPRIAYGVLLAIRKILEISSDLRDYLMVVLRKTMFAREVEPRLISVFGFLTLLGISSSSRNGFKNNHIHGNSNALGSSSSSSHFSIADYQLDSLQCLRRCFSQQSIVRKALYSGLTIIFKQQMELREYIYDMLASHLKNYIDKPDEDLSPLKFHDCVDPSSGQLKEPLDHLVYSVFICHQTILADSHHITLVRDGLSSRSQSNEQSSKGNGMGSDESFPQFPLFSTMRSSILQVITNLSRATPGNFSLDKKSNFSSDSQSGMFNQNLLSLILSTSDALINYSVLENSPLDLQNNPRAIRKVLHKFSGLYQFSSTMRNFFYSCVEDLEGFGTQKKKDEALPYPGLLLDATCSSLLLQIILETGFQNQNGSSSSFSKEQADDSLRHKIGIQDDTKKIIQEKGPVQFLLYSLKGCLDKAEALVLSHAFDGKMPTSSSSTITTDISALIKSYAGLPNAASKPMNSMFEASEQLLVIDSTMIDIAKRCGSDGSSKSLAWNPNVISLLIRVFSKFGESEKENRHQKAPTKVKEEEIVSITDTAPVKNEEQSDEHVAEANPKKKRSKKVAKVTNASNESSPVISTSHVNSSLSLIAFDLYRESVVILRFMNKEKFGDRFCDAMKSKYKIYEPNQEEKQFNEFSGSSSIESSQQSKKHPLAKGIKLLQDICDDAIENENANVVHICLKLLSLFLEEFEPGSVELQEVKKWIIEVCEVCTIRNSSIIHGVVEFATCLDQRSGGLTNSLDVTLQLAESLSFMVGKRQLPDVVRVFNPESRPIDDSIDNTLDESSSESDEEKLETSKSEHKLFSIITSQSLPSVFNPIVGVITNMLDDCECAIDIISGMQKSTKDSQSQEEKEIQNHMYESLLYKRMKLCAKILEQLVSGEKIPTIGTLFEPLLKVTVQFYKILGMAVSKIGIQKKTILAFKSFRKLLLFISGTLVPQTFGMLKVNRDDLVAKSQSSASSQEDDDNETTEKKTSKKNGKKRKRVVKTANVRKESKLVPEVVFHLEQYEILLVKLTKVSQSCNEFLKFVHRSTARDFKLEIRKSKKKETLSEENEVEEEQENVEEGEEENDDDESDNENEDGNDEATESEPAY